jgi:hypothetical protein
MVVPPLIMMLLYRSCEEHGPQVAVEGVGGGTNFADVDVTLVNCVVHQLTHALLLHAEERGLKQRLGAPEALRSHSDDLTIGQRVLLFTFAALRGSLHLGGAVQRHVAQLLLDVTHDFLLGS